MPTYRYPVLTWSDPSGGHTAVLAGDFETAAAYAATADEALRQLKELLEWRLEQEPWNVDPDLSEPAELKSLVGHYVKEALTRLTPAQLASRLPPRACRLEEIALRGSGMRIRRIPFANRSEMKVLFSVADPLLSDFGRKRAAS